MAANSSGRIKPRPGPKLFSYLRWAAKRRAGMIVDLANLPDDDEDWFWRRWRGDYIRTNYNRPLCKYRDELQTIWSVPLSPSHEWDTRANIRLRLWLNEAQQQRHTWRLSAGCVLPDFSNLPLSLAVAVSELAPRMTICQNPKCPIPYFLKGKSTQTFCGQPACIRYGQREHKKKWWAEHGEQWRQERQRDRRKKPNAKKTI
jgi:hypothetical protein